MHFRDHFLLYSLIPLTILLVMASGYRFMGKYDYDVAYEVECDPAAQVCFVGCGNDECTETYYYAEVQKYAADLRAQCGDDITGCEASAQCLPGDQNCSVTYCDPETDGESCSAPPGESSSATSTATDIGL